VVPDGRAGGEFDGAIGAAIPEGDGIALPDSPGVLQHMAEFGQVLSLDRRPPAALASGRYGGIQVGIEAQPCDDVEIASYGGEELDGGKGGVANDEDAAAWQPAVDLQGGLTGPVKQRLGAARLIGIEALGGRKHGEKGQAHDAVGPRYVDQQLRG